MSIDLNAIQKPLEAAMFHAPYKVVNGAFGKKVVQANNHPSLRPYVLADNLPPIIAEFIATAPENMTALLAYARDLEARVKEAEAVALEEAAYDILEAQPIFVGSWLRARAATIRTDGA